jgi:hypothetical protein
MGLFSSSKNAKPKPQKIEYDKGKGANARHVTREVSNRNGTIVETVSEQKIATAHDWQALKQSRKDREIKLHRTKKDDDSIRAFLDAGNKEFQIGTLKKEISKNKDGAGFRYRCYVEDIAIGCLPSLDIEDLAHVLGIEINEMPDVFPCTLMLRKYDERIWTGCRVL